MGIPLHVLIVEDSEDDALVLLYTLRNEGYDPIFERVDSAQAMDAALNKTWDVIICDYKMPGFGAIAALELLQAKGQDIPFIILSGTIDEETAVTAMKAGAHDFILKQRMARLIPAIEREIREAKLRRKHAQAEVEKELLFIREQEARQQAESANRIKDEFLTILSHELRTPLNPILGWLKILKTRKLSEETASNALNTIERNAKLLSQLIEDLLNVSQILEGKISLSVGNIDLVSVMQAAIETVSLAAEVKSINLSFSVIPTDENGNHPLHVAGDPKRLQQVFWHLLSNAVKFTPRCGQIEIQLAHVNNHAQITINDTGKGISPEFIPHVFDYFLQADNSITRNFGGLGLGLAIVRYLVEAHGGTVGVQSPGTDQGSTFTVLLPNDTAKTTNNRPNTQKSLTLHGKNILVVGSEADTREFLGFLLQEYGAVVQSVVCASEALTALLKSKPDLLLSDLRLPFFESCDLIRQIRDKSPEQGGLIPAIALTAYVGEIDKQQVLAAGFQEYMSKPVDPTELVNAIANLIN